MGQKNVSTLDPYEAKRMKKEWKNFYKVLCHCFKILR